MIIGICGQAGAGKDTVADFLVENHGFVKIALADPIKRAARDWFDFSNEQLWGPSHRRNKPDHRYLICEGYAEAYEEHRTKDPELASGYEKSGWLTPRQALQIMGTEVGRRCYQNVWVEYAMRVANALLKKDYSKGEPVYRYNRYQGLVKGQNTAFTGTPMDELPLGVIISDVRFRNEVKAIKAAAGYVWRIDRPGAGLKDAAGAHQSETEQNEIDPKLFSFTLLNDGTLEDLCRITGDVVQENFRLNEEQLRFGPRK